jgi:hypothetical protein
VRYRNDDSYKELAPIEQKGQETTTEDTSSADQIFDSMTVKQLASYCKDNAIKGYSKHLLIGRERFIAFVKEKVLKYYK